MRANNFFMRIFLFIIVSTIVSGCTNRNHLNNLEKWDLVYICDSTGWGVAEKYAENIERDTKKTVRVKDYAIGGLSALEVLDVLYSDPEELDNNDKFKSLQYDITEAEVVVLFANPRGELSRGGVQGGMEKCIDYKAGNPPDSCTPQMYQPFTKNLKAIYKEIFSLRDGEPTIIRAVDLYNPVISEHRKRNMEIECRKCQETFNKAIRNAADEFSIPFVSVYDAFNGPDHDEDPREKGYIGDDGIHTSEKGKQLIADLLSKIGYEPVGK